MDNAISSASRRCIKGAIRTYRNKPNLGCQAIALTLLLIVTNNLFLTTRTMAYRCKDCSYSRNGIFPNGACPACGSFNIAGKEPLEKQAAQKNSKLRLLALAGLWGYLLFLLYQKFFV